MTMTQYLYALWSGHQLISMSPNSHKNISIELELIVMVREHTQRNWRKEKLSAYGNL